VRRFTPIILDGNQTCFYGYGYRVLTGRSLPEVMMMVVPEAWEKHQTMSDDKKAFYSIMLVL
jgi:glutamate synthase (ferredoxin)